jgi:hypothetical protein
VWRTARGAGPRASGRHRPLRRAARAPVSRIVEATALRQAKSMQRRACGPGWSGGTLAGGGAASGGSREGGVGSGVDRGLCVVAGCLVAGVNVAGVRRDARGEAKEGGGDEEGARPAYCFQANLGW